MAMTLEWRPIAENVTVLVDEHQRCHFCEKRVDPNAMVCVKHPEGEWYVMHRRCGLDRKGFPKDLAKALRTTYGPLLLVFEDERRLEVYAMGRVVS